MVKHKSHKFKDAGSNPAAVNMFQQKSFLYFNKKNTLPTILNYWFFSGNKGITEDRLFCTIILDKCKAPAAYNCSRSTSHTLFFLRKEAYYTKLKYSRVPQFDTSAGAVASFTSGMYGFMVCEKFGFELLDSGDFIFMVLYIAIVCLIASLLTSIFNTTTDLPLSFLSIMRSFKI